jgi:hypothetical protein
VNIAARQLGPDLLATVEHALNSNGIAPKDLTLKSPRPSSSRATSVRKDRSPS